MYKHAIALIFITTTCMSKLESSQYRCQIYFKTGLWKSLLSYVQNPAWNIQHVCQSLREIALWLFTQIQPIPENVAQPCNFVQFPQFPAASTHHLRHTCRSLVWRRLYVNSVRDGNARRRSHLPAALGNILHAPVHTRIACVTFICFKTGFLQVLWVLWGVFCSLWH